MSTEALIDLYRAGSKHGQYQALPAGVERLLPADALSIQSRHEHERLAYLSRYVDVNGKRVADIGGNSGFFSFELLERGASRVDHVEGNREHSLFVAQAARLLGVGDRLTAYHRYLDFHAPALDVYDVVLLLNVLHHIGDDYGDPDTAIEQVLPSIRASLVAMASHARQLVFQLGFNWQGDRRRPIFRGGSRREVIELVESLSDTWAVEAIGIARREGEAIVYVDADATNIARDDALGEFLNRPLFVLRSRCAPAA